jgi:hypothetical protein
LTEELSQTSNLVQRLVEANQASTHAASLQADLNKDLVSLALSRGITRSTPVVSSLPAPVQVIAQPKPPKLLKQPKSPTPPRKLLRYKKFWSDKGTPGSDVSLTELPTEEVSFLGAAKRVPLETRITTEPKPLLERIESPAPYGYGKSLSERIETPVPFGFEPYTPKELPPLEEDKRNFYQDPRPPKRRH